MINEPVEQRMCDTNTLKWAENLPKVEIHLHLEGAIPLDTLYALILKYGGHPEVPDIDTLERKFIFRDFHHFIDTWVWKNQFIREYDDFTLIAEDVAQDLARQNIKYAEIFYSPIEHERDGLSVQGITTAIRKGLDRVTAIDVGLIADLVRDVGPVLGMRTLHDLKDVQSLGVIGIGMGGSEKGNPPEPWAEVYEQARSWGFHTTAHAGEAEGVGNIWGAIRALKVERIGHGIRAVDDPVLMTYLAEQRIPLEVCPLSNVRTAVVSTYTSHPIRCFYNHNLMVTVNTDDPKMFGNALAQEYAMLVQHLGFSRDDILTLILNGIRASWLSAQRKHDLEMSFIHCRAWSPLDVMET
jgi:adenosine deaminase